MKSENCNDFKIDKKSKMCDKFFETQMSDIFFLSWINKNMLNKNHRAVMNYIKFHILYCMVCKGGPLTTMEI